MTLLIQSFRGEVSGRHWRGIGANVGDLGAHVRVIQDFGDFGVEFFNDGPWCSHRGKQPDPARQVIAWNAAFSQRWQIGHQSAALGGCGGDGAQLAGFDLGLGRRDVGEHEVHTTAHHVHHGLRIAFVGHPQQLPLHRPGERFTHHHAAGISSGQR